jgi:hypothetical protein
MGIAGHRDTFGGDELTFPPERKEIILKPRDAPDTRKKRILNLLNKPGMSFRISTRFGTNPFFRDIYGRLNANRIASPAKGLAPRGNEPWTGPVPQNSQSPIKAPVKGTVTRPLCKHCAGSQMRVHYAFFKWLAGDKADLSETGRAEGVRGGCQRDLTDA